MARARAFGQAPARGAYRAERLLGVVVAGLLLLDAGVHARDAGIYDANRTSLLSQGGLFRAEAVLAAALAVAVALRPRRLVWAGALLVAGSAAGAAVLYRYVDLGRLGPLPNMYEPTWAAPGKVLSVAAESLAVPLSVAGLLLAARALHREHLRAVAGPVAAPAFDEADRPGMSGL